MWRTSDHRRSNSPIRLAVNLAWGWRATLGILILGGLLLAGCGGKDIDPVEFVRELIPQIQEGLNNRDIAGLKKLGTTTFEANRFITDVFSRGARGDVSLSMVRFRHVPGQVRLVLNAAFGEDGKGGLKELTIYLSDKTKRLKMDTYSLRDKYIPPPEPQPDVFDSLPPDEATSQDPS